VDGFGQTPSRIPDVAAMAMAMGSLQTPRERLQFWVQRGQDKDIEHRLGVNDLDFHMFYILTLDDIMLSAVRNDGNPWEQAMSELFDSLTARLPLTAKAEDLGQQVEQMGKLRDALVQEWHPQGLLSKAPRSAISLAKPAVEGFAHERYLAEEDVFRELAKQALEPGNWSGQIVAEFIRREGHEYS
jgi:hypothetical protein